jgi:hypothetical protein
LDDNKDGSFKLGSGDESTPDLELISHDKVWVQLFLSAYPIFLQLTNTLPRKTVVDLNHGSCKQLWKKALQKDKTAKAQSGPSASTLKCAWVTMEEISDEQAGGLLHIL